MSGLHVWLAPQKLNQRALFSFPLLSFFLPFFLLFPFALVLLFCFGNRKIRKEEVGADGGFVVGGWGRGWGGGSEPDKPVQQGN